MAERKAVYGTCPECKRPDVQLYRRSPEWIKQPQTCLGCTLKAIFAGTTGRQVGP